MFYKYDSNEEGPDPDYIGLSLWHPELLNDARGDFLQMRVRSLDFVNRDKRSRLICHQHRDLLRILYNAAVKEKNTQDNASSGVVTVHFDAEVTKIDCDACSVTMRSGEAHRADAIIGADVVRDDVPTGLSVYSTVIPKAVAMEHEELAKLYEYPRSKMVNVFMGHNRAAKVSIAGKDEDVLVGLYTPDSSEGGTWTEEAARDIQEVVGSSNNLLEGLAAHAGPSSCVQIQDHSELDSWVSKSGKVAVIGEAAHPFPPASTHACSVAIEDGAFIGKIFSHTRNSDRIEEFLHAFEKHRRPRCAYILQAEKKNIGFFTLPGGEKQAARDASMRANQAAGVDVMEAPEADMQHIWDDFAKVFGYEPADDADEWWVSWGRFRD
ncbi:hypothetical protein B0H17DRAFT_634236 [Mycena rosella]|uniref:FAD-binding domain-containing protein n=1 Tax=Mycena rosella TaxID=1033263 RepID=A0AAD7DEW5_MYCRO|nr:hypothetical protein B0H17DRAFT_634236 [Mycena rosella]